MTQTPPSSGRAAAKGMAWTAVALIISKMLSFLSQIALGYLLSVETYAVFALLTTAMIFINGFQHSGVGKALVQQHDKLDELLPKYAAFTLWLGLIGMAVFLLVGLVFEQIYEIRPLFWVIAVAAISLPVKAATTIYVAVLSVDYRFRDISMAEVKHAFCHYAVLVGAAALGANGFTMAIAIALSGLYHLYVLSRATPDTKLTLRMSFATFVEMTVQLRWVILSAFLFSLGMNGDYLLLGNMLSAEELGYYFFGFTLVANLTVMISMGIGRALLPIFSKLKNDLPELRRQYLKIGGAITLMMSIICIGLIGMGPMLVHLVWGGKWDPSIIIVVSIAAILPVRIMANLGGIVFEAQGAWGWRLLTLIFHAVFLLVCAYVGVTLGGLTGAIIAVAFQRWFSGVMTFPMAAHMIGITMPQVGGFFLRCFGLYTLIVAALIAIDPWRHVTVQESTDFARPILETTVALAVFVLANWFINRDLMKAMTGLIPKRLIPTRKAS